MIEQIKKDKPQGATHWQAGTYLKVVCDQDVYKRVDGEWVHIGNAESFYGLNILCMTPLRG